MFLPAVLCLFPKKVCSSYAFFQRHYKYLYGILAVIHSLNGIVLFFLTLKANTHFLSAYFRTPVTAKLISHRSSCIFRAASIILISEQPLEVATTLQNFFKIPICLEQLRLPYNYTLETNTFFAPLLLKDKYFFSAATILEELFLQKK